MYSSIESRYVYKAWYWGSLLLKKKLLNGISHKPIFFCQELSVIPALKKELSRSDEKVAAVQSILDEKKAQLTHARYTLRDNKTTIKVGVGQAWVQLQS